ncbi:MAG: hydrogenase 4 subunit B [Leptospirales bacterium]
MSQLFEGSLFLTPLTLSLASLVLWLGLGGLGYGTVRIFRQSFPSLFYLSIIPAGTMVYSGVWALSGSPRLSLDLGWGLPGLPFSFVQDPLSSYFLVVLGIVSMAVFVYSAGFFRDAPISRTGWVLLWMPVFLGTMSGVLLAADAFTFLLFWEGMALSSFFLVLTHVDQGWVRQAGFLYLLMAHVGTGLILLAFSLLSLGSPVSGTGALSFSMMGHSPLPGWIRWSVFLLSLVGFGAKAGLVPLHVWLPEAHPAAPAPASALLSGLMLKIAIYGLLRMDLDLLGIHHIEPVMGAIVLFIGSSSALFGVLHALMQHEPKRLLAYHSIENIGIIMIGFGLFLLFWSTKHFVPATVALSASLFHVLNHALFKSLLFMGAGSVVEQTHAHDINRLGGLIHRMPITFLSFLVGALSISGLPPLNGFVSEWMTFQSALWSTEIHESFLQSLVVLSAASLALSSALTAMCFVKVIGVSFLGAPRSPASNNAREASIPECFGMGILALLCVLAGLFPFVVTRTIEPVVLSLTGDTLPSPVLSHPYLWFVPVSVHQAQYSPLSLVFLLIAIFGVLFFWARFSRSRTRVAPAWNCGYPVRTPRMQDTADAFGQPVRRFFAPFFRMERTLPGPGDVSPKYSLKVEDPFWHYLYRPVVSGVFSLSEQVDRIRNKRVSQYLVYSFLTLFLLLLYFEATS